MSIQALDKIINDISLSNTLLDFSISSRNSSYISITCSADIDAITPTSDEESIIYECLKNYRYINNYLSHSIQHNKMVINNSGIREELIRSMLDDLIFKMKQIEDKNENKYAKSSLWSMMKKFRNSCNKSTDEIIVCTYVYVQKNKALFTSAVESDEVNKAKNNLKTMCNIMVDRWMHS